MKQVTVPEESTHSVTTTRDTNLPTVTPANVAPLAPFRLGLILTGIILLMFTSGGIWWVGYEYGAHRHTSMKQDVMFYLLAPACGLANYLLTLQTNKKRERLSMVLTVACVPGACVLAAWTAFLQGQIPLLNLTTMPFCGAVLGRIVVDILARKQRQNSGSPRV